MSAPDSTADLYEALQVSPSASSEVIEAAYKGLMRKYGADPDPAVREQRAALEHAYDVLSNDERRAAYDRSRNGSVIATPVEPPRPTRLGGATVVQCARHPEVQ